MDKRKKNIIMVLAVSLIVMVFFGFSYAALTYTNTGTNQELIVGDIWMKYTGTNQIELNDSIPNNGIKVLKTEELYEYFYNENMTSDEMNACIEYANGLLLRDGETVEAYCAGTGTLQERTIKEHYNVYRTYQLNDELIENNIVIEGEVIPSQRIIYTDLEYNEEATEEEINKCVEKIDWYEFDPYNNKNYLVFDEGTTAESYCRGTGTIDGKTLSERLKNIDDLPQYELLEFSSYLAVNIIKPVVNLPYFEFTIDGKNTYTKKDIIYDIVLSYGDNHETRTTRIKDENLQFTLIEVDEDGNFVDVLLNKQKYFDLSNKRIWVERIPANSNAEVNKKYRLYMYIASDTVIGNIEQDYTLDEWADVYASIKVGVNGDFNEKELETTDESCFTGYIQKIYTYNENMTEDEINACIDYFQYYYFAEDETEEAYCRGTGTRDGTTIREDFNNYIGGSYWESHETLITNNILVFVDYGDYVITDYDENCGGYVNFPETIEGYKLTEIELDAFYDKGIIDVTFSSNIKHISTASFMSNNLTDVFIPSNVTQFACDAFDYDVNITYENENLVCVEEGGNA